MSCQARKALTALLAVVAVSFVAHYVLFGSLPLGKPQLLDEETDAADAAGD
jgi:hypothetical protein